MIEEMERVIDLRHQQLSTLLDLTVEQEAAIQDGHMNELMRILGDKQRIIEAFAQASKELTIKRNKYAERPNISQPHRDKNEQCNLMHAELLEREAACQSTLKTSRDEIASELTRGEGAKRAASGYGQVSAQTRPQGGGLDLSQ